MILGFLETSVLNAGYMYNHISYLDIYTKVYVCIYIYIYIYMDDVDLLWVTNVTQSEA